MNQPTNNNAPGGGSGSAVTSSNNNIRRMIATMDKFKESQKEILEKMDSSK